jgi:hypothetical protein
MVLAFQKQATGAVKLRRTLTTAHRAHIPLEQIVIWHPHPGGIIKPLPHPVPHLSPAISIPIRLSRLGAEVHAFNHSSMALLNEPVINAGACPVTSIATFFSPWA